MAIVRWRPGLGTWPWLAEDWDWPEMVEEKGLDIYETEDTIMVEAPVPGVAKEDLDITVEGGVVRIKGECEESEEDEKDKKYYVKRAKKSFYYQASLPAKGKWDEAEAEVVDGMVKITIPKAEEVKPKKITVK
jgi:HSP20 family protein